MSIERQCNDNEMTMECQRDIFLGEEKETLRCAKDALREIRRQAKTIEELL